jgi:ADP-ribose pyrophosphatase YjhB (NUDIX family)
MRAGIDYIGITVVFFCHDGNGNVLLHKRSENCRDEVGRWDCGAGRVEHGETFEEALHREIKEEYGAVPREVIFAGANNVLRNQEDKTTHWVALTHAVLVDPSEVVNGEPHKIEELGWFPFDDMPEPLHSMLQRDADLTREHIKPTFKKGGIDKNRQV